METVNQAQVLFFAIAILLVFLLIFAGFCYTYWLSQQSPNVSPYSGLPLRRGSDLSFDAREKILRVLYELHDIDNQMFDIQNAAVCRETGRVFPNAINWLNQIKVDWGFLQKRQPGNYVSWGSLLGSEQDAVRWHHDSLEGFQTDYSCPRPDPKMIEAHYALSKPGPLYVDLKRNILLGWKIVPETDFEVLIVQKPVR